MQFIISQKICAQIANFMSKFAFLKTRTRAARFLYYNLYFMVVRLDYNVWAGSQGCAPVFLARFLYIYLYHNC